MIFFTMLSVDEIINTQIMKKIVILVIALTGISVFSNAQTVNRDLQSLYGIAEATWCGHCGRNGIPTTKSLENSVGNKAVFMSLHQNSSSDLHSADAAILTQALNHAGGQPSWSLNGVSEGYYSTSLVQDLTDKINTYYDQNNALVNANGSFSVTNSDIQYNIDVEFFDNGNNQDYYLQLYVMENDITAYQANYDPNIPNGNIQHHHILRKAMLPNGAYGNLIATAATATQGYTKNFTATFPLDPTWDKNNIYLAAVIWQYDGTNYTYYNANDDIKFNSAPTAVKDVSKNDVVLYPNPIKAGEQLKIDVAQIQSVSLYNMQGIKIGLDVLQNNTVEIPATLASGLYFIKGEAAGKTFTKKISVQ